MAGKAYARAIRMHKMTLQALWQLILPQLYSYLDEHDTELKEKLQNDLRPNNSNLTGLLNTLSTEKFRSIMNGFELKLREDNPNFLFWWQYMDMVSILLDFVRAQRDGIWDLHLYAFRRMLPFFFRYDHTNYARWGTVYLSEMNCLPPEVLQEFRAGNFVIKMSHRKFSQVSPDHSQEWMIGTGKKCGGIVGITKTINALGRWSLSYNLRTCLSIKTKQMLMIADEETEYVYNELTPARKKRDNMDEEKIVSAFRDLDVLNNDVSSTVLQNISTKDLALESIQHSLLHAEQLGQVQLDAFVAQRILEPRDSTAYINFNAVLQRNKPQTFSSLYNMHCKEIKTKETTIKADRGILQRLLTASKAGREIDLNQILRHELMPVPISLANMDGSLNSGSNSKYKLANLLIEDVSTPDRIALTDTTCLIIDGQALVMLLGKPSGLTTFGEYANRFANVVFSMGEKFDRIDVTFDRYPQHSIKNGTRMKRSKTSRPIRRVIENTNVPLPDNWKGFLSIGENKANLAEFLCQQLLINAATISPTKLLVVAGGFADIREAKSSDPEMDTSPLAANHEEADTRIILHCANTNAQTVVVLVRDTDVLVLLASHFHKMPCTQLWMKAGTLQKPRYIPIHVLHQKIPSCQLKTLLSFHAITGCDSVSHIAGHGKKTAWKVFQIHNTLLTGLSTCNITEGTINKAENFICRLYRVPDNVETCDQARVILFSKGCPQETLPPTSDAVRQHIRRAHYQATIWEQATVATPVLPPVIDMEWQYLDGNLVPKLMTITPIPKACREIITCNCQKGCSSGNCSCRKSKLACTGGCACTYNSQQCRNIHD